MRFKLLERTDYIYDDHFTYLGGGGSCLGSNNEDDHQIIQMERSCNPEIDSVSDMYESKPLLQDDKKFDTKPERPSQEELPRFRV